MDGAGRSLTSVPGLRVGQAGDPDAMTGCTVVLGPFRGAVDVRGTATGSRELDALSLLHLVPRVDALLLTGGSAFGLGAADGVVGWLEERGRGFETPAAAVPIVPTAVIYDLGVGDPEVRPDAAMGYRATEAAHDGPVEEGRVGAGTGATVGKLLGPAGAEAGGVGTWALEAGDHRMGALAVVNAFGDVRDARGGILAGCRGEDGAYADTARRLRAAELPAEFAPGQHTTLGVVATDRPLDRRELRLVARQAMNALARRLSPAGSVLDGDLVFALSTGGPGRPGDGTPGATPGELLALGAAAQEALEVAIERAVSTGREGP